MNYSITTKGQVTIPKELRDAIGLKIGGKAAMSLLNERTIAITAPLPIETIREQIGPPANDQPLSAKDRRRLQARGLM